MHGGKDILQADKKLPSKFFVIIRNKDINGHFQMLKCFNSDANYFLSNLFTY